MTSFGKYLGGGVSFGAFGGRADLMARFDPGRADAVSHAGTFNNNVISMAAGLAGLRELYTHAAADRLNARRRPSARAPQRAGRQARRADAGAGRRLHHGGAFPSRHDQRRRRTCGRRTRLPPPSIAELQKLFHLDLIEHGQYMARRGFISLSLPMTDADFERFAAAVEEFLAVRGPVVSATID